MAKPTLTTPAGPGMLTRLGAALSFAHLGSIGSRAPRAAAAESDDKKDDDEDDKDKSAKAGTDGPSDEGEDDPDRKKKDDESDDEYAKRMAAMDDDEQAAAKKAGAGADDDDKKKDDKDDDDSEMRGNSPAAQARVREQARCAAIFASPAAARNPVLAAKLAFTTRMPRSEALALLEGTPAPRAAVVSHPERAASNPKVSSVGGAALSGEQASAAFWDGIRAKATGAAPAARTRNGKQH